MAVLQANAALFRRLAAQQLQPWLTVVGSCGGERAPDGQAAGGGGGGAAAEAAAISPLIHLVLTPTPPRDKVCHAFLRG